MNLRKPVHFVYDQLGYYHRAMSKDDINYWEQKYSGDGYEPDRSPSALLTEWLDDRPPGSALDLACGTGRNALYLAGKGYAVSAVDSSPRAIGLAEQAARKEGLKINWIVADLDDYAIREQYDLIVISFFYPDRNLVPLIVNALKKGVFYSMKTTCFRLRPQRKKPVNTVSI